MTNEDMMDWPKPSYRWRSFEAEAFPVTAYRYDSRLPSVIGREGFKGYFEDVRISKPAHSLFGKDTVFAAGSRAGADNFLNKYNNIFNRNDNGIVHRLKRLKYRLSAQESNIDDLYNSHLYKIETDTHNSVPFRDFHENFKGGFTRYTFAGGREKIYGYGAEEFARVTRVPSKWFIMDRLDWQIKGIYHDNDEIQIKGPIAAAEVQSPIKYAGLEYLNLDVECMLAR